MILVAVMTSRASGVRVGLYVAVALLFGGSLVLAARAQTQPAGQAPAGQTTPQSYPPEQVEAGQKIFSAQCGFCHGRDAMGGESGPDLTSAALVAEDVRGDKLGPVVRNGRVDKGMPAFNLSDFDLLATVAYIHDQKRKAELPGRRRSVDVADLQTGNVEAGQRYFETSCTKCHSPTGDLAGLAKRLQGLALLQRMLYPGSGRDAKPPAPPKVTVTLPSGEKVSGVVAYRDEFTIALTDPTGWYRSWPIRLVKFTVDDPLQAHVEQLRKYTDRDMHDVLAYLQTLR
jgi:cytochrome c oxidase cbb3-type subunit III